MIYLFHGTDVERTRTKAFEWVAKAREKEPNLAYLRLAREELSLAALSDVAASGGLFVHRTLVLLDDPFQASAVDDEEEKRSDVVEEHLALLADSENAIVILAPKLSLTKLKKVGAKATKTYTFDVRAAAPARGFNSALVDALSARDRKGLWLEIIRSTRAGDAPEMLHGLLHWKARDLMQKGSRAWTRDEARQLSLDLLALVRDARRGGLDLSLALERFALSI